MRLKLKPCPCCWYGNKLWLVHVLPRRLPFWWYVECERCHWCGKTKLFRWRAIRSWNRREN